MSTPEEHMKQRAISIVIALAFAAVLLQAVAAPAQAVAPTPTTPVAITGNPTPGQTLHAVAATWPVAGTSTFEWTRGAEQVGMGEEYAVKPADATRTLTLTETFVSAGNDPATSTATVVVGKIPAQPPATPVDIAGTPRVGQTLSAVGGVWTYAGDASYAWTVDGTTVSTTTSYVVRPADLGKVVKLTKSFASPTHETSTSTAQTAPVTADAPAPTTAVKITGKAQVGSTLKVKPATWPVTGTSTFAWEIGGSRVGTGRSYQLKPADAGSKVTVYESFVSPSRDAATTSARSATVAKAPVSLTVKTGSVKRCTKVPVTIRATSPGPTVPGKVKVTYAGKGLGKVKLKSGKATVELPGKRKGSYRLSVTYLGATGFARQDKTITVKVR
jgi:immune inhibitor A